MCSLFPLGVLGAAALCFYMSTQSVEKVAMAKENGDWAVIKEQDGLVRFCIYRALNTKTGECFLVFKETEGMAVVPCGEKNE